jgi:hypothetical protein
MYAPACSMLSTASFEKLYRVISYIRHYIHISVP